MGSEPIVDLIEIDGNPAVQIYYVGKLYKFARTEKGVRCVWWEGQRDYDMFRILNPYATKALREQSRGASHPSGEEVGYPVHQSSSRPISPPSGPSCLHCGNQFHSGEQVSDKCPNCGENPFE